MTKAQLTTLINTIDTGGLNTAQEVRNVLEGIKNEMFNETETIENNNLGELNYKITFEKIGNICFVNGYLKNNTANAIIPSDYAIPITNDNFKPKATGQYFSSIYAPYLYGVLIVTIGNITGISLVNLDDGNYEFINVPAMSTFNFNGFYKIND